MKKIILILIAVIYSFTFCTKEESTVPYENGSAPNYLPLEKGRRVDVQWTDTVGKVLYGIATFKDNGEVRKFSAIYKPEENKYSILSGKDGIPGTDLQFKCMCWNCNLGWSPNISHNFDNCLNCPICNGKAENTYFGNGICGWVTAECFLIWV